jgi:hypothetical protein
MPGDSTLARPVQANAEPRLLSQAGIQPIGSRMEENCFRIRNSKGLLPVYKPHEFRLFFSNQSFSSISGSCFLLVNGDQAAPSQSENLCWAFIAYSNWGPEFFPRYGLNRSF